MDFVLLSTSQIQNWRQIHRQSSSEHGDGQNLARCSKVHMKVLINLAQSTIPLPSITSLMKKSIHVSNMKACGHPIILPNIITRSTYSCLKSKLVIGLGILEMWPWLLHPNFPDYIYTSFHTNIIYHCSSILDFVSHGLVCWNPECLSNSFSGQVSQKLAT